MNLSLIIARFVKTPKTRKRSRAAANSPALADISDDANGRFAKGHDLSFFFEDIHRLHKTKTLSASKMASHMCFVKRKHTCA